MEKKKVILIVIALFTLLAFAMGEFWLMQPQKKPRQRAEVNDMETASRTSPETEDRAPKEDALPPAPTGNDTANLPDKTEEGLTISIPKSGGQVRSPLVVSGKISGNGWTGFEGQAGTVELLDAQGNRLAIEPLTATTEWTKLPITFKTTLTFNAMSAGTGTLVFKNENPSGDPQRDKEFRLPVNITASFSIPSADTMTVSVFYANSKLDPQQSCDTVFEVKRKIGKTPGMAKASLQELLKGPSEQEKADGYNTTINEGVTIQQLTINNGVAKVDFSQELGKDVAGSCRVTAIRSQITQTLKQFPTVKSVVISIDGKTEDILQP